MKITQNPVSPNLAATTDSKVGERTPKHASHPAPDKASRSGTRVELSDEAKLLRHGVDAVKSSHGTDRAAKIADIKKQVQAGTYKVDAGAIADRLVDEHFLTEIAAGNS